jgi:demethylmenaquinone methyltransferase/2-methoxy-6-polyprenyl-1,4-benzoquinol methylase
LCIADRGAQPQRGQRSSVLGGLPRIGQLFAKNQSDAYEYLPATVAQFPDGEALAERMRSVGLKNVKHWPLTFGIATLYVGKK